MFFGSKGRGNPVLRHERRRVEPDVANNDLCPVIALDPGLDECPGQFTAQGTIGSSAGINMKKGGHEQIPVKPEARLPQ
ncbi:hypothetical protein D3C84_965810 [compost metagenome]